MLVIMLGRQSQVENYEKLNLGNIMNGHFIVILSLFTISSLIVLPLISFSLSTVIKKHIICRVFLDETSNKQM